MFGYFYNSMFSRKKVAVVILSWNGKGFLERFLPSVVQHTASADYEVIVADNCSTDDSVDFVKSNFPSVRIVLNSHNGGFAAGYNEALKHIDAEYYVLLNQDVEVTSGWIERVLAEMEKDSTIVAAQPKIKAWNNRDYFEYAGASGGYVDWLGYPYCRGRIFDTVEKDEGQYDDVADIFWATGACMFIKADIYWKAGALDEDFFAHQEEIDLCWRVLNMGYRIICVPDAVVYHVGGGSLPQGNPRKTFLNFRNNLAMMFKNLPVETMPFKIVFRIALDIVAGLQSVFKDAGFKTLAAILKAHLAFYMWLPQLIKKRNALQSTGNAQLSKASILWQYFVAGKKKYSQIQR
jgi:GT2 family glycosyltransferase